MTNPLVSVIIPIFNHARFIERALESVTKQTYRPLELIVIDDGSTDGGAELASAYLKREMPDAVVVRRENQGAHNTINQGLRLASGEYLTILNSDDSYDQERLAKCVQTATLTKREFIFTGVAFMDEFGNEVVDDDYVEAIRRTQELSTRYPTAGFALMKNQIAISTGNFFFSRGLYKKLIGFRHYRFVHDWDFILRALFYTEPYLIDEQLYHYRLHGSNSFKSLKSLEGYETTEVMRNFLWLMMYRTPENPTAPCPHYWPGFFDWFIEIWNYQVYMPNRHQAR